MILNGDLNIENMQVSTRSVEIKNIGNCLTITMNIHIIDSVLT